MALTKADIINQIYTSHPNLTKTQAKDAVETLLSVMKSRLETGDDILLSGFGKFSIKNKSARKGRNPQTGEEMILEPRRVVTFKSSGNLRDRVNNN